MLPSQRELIILQLLQEEGVVTVAQICDRCACSQETARRDLRRMEGKELLERTYGGAIRREAPAHSSGRANGREFLEKRALLMDRADVLIVTPSETAATRRLIERARRTGIPIVAESDSYPGAATVVAIDDYQAGIELGAWVADYAKAARHGPLHVLDVTAPFANTNARSRGFAEGLRRQMQEEAVIQRVVGEGMRTVAKRRAADALQINPAINVIFGVNDDSALGALEAYRALELDEAQLIVVSFGSEGRATKELLNAGGCFKASVAMFPELVGQICVDVAICAYRGERLPERIHPPYALMTQETLEEYYRWDTSQRKWRFDHVCGRAMVDASPSLARLHDSTQRSRPSHIGFVKIFSSHEWYQNMEQAMQARAGALGIQLEIVDASRDLVREIDSLKQSIGGAAAHFVNPGDTIILDAGLTTAYLAAALRGRREIQVITNSVRVLTALVSEGGIDLIAMGGITRSASQSLVGPNAENALRELRADKAFLGGAGISTTFGLSNENMAEASVKRAMIGAAREVFLLADHTKIGVESLIKIADLAAIDTLIVDAGISVHDRTAFTQAGVDVVVADE